MAREKIKFKTRECKYSERIVAGEIRLIPAPREEGLYKIIYGDNGILKCGITEWSCGRIVHNPGSPMIGEGYYSDNLGTCPSHKSVIIEYEGEILEELKYGVLLVDIKKYIGDKRSERITETRTISEEFLDSIDKFKTFRKDI